MADRGGKGPGLGPKPVPMRLFATWEVEKTSPNCIPRLCSLTLTRLVINKSLEADLQSVIVAVKMQSSKRVLRSNEIIVSPSGLLDTELDLSFSLQYPHFLKRDGNKLQVMLQRRKKYKNRTILGYKTLAIGIINMTQVLQHAMDRELNLYSDPKEHTNLVAQVTMLSLTSQPVDHEENGRQKLTGTGLDRSPDVDLSDEEYPPEYQEDSSNEEILTDSEPNQEEETGIKRSRKTNIRQAAISRQRNIKQKFIALLKRFKVTEEALDSEQDPEMGDQEVPHDPDIDDLLFDEIEDLSDSDQDLSVDKLSIISTPKPKLKPFFTGVGRGSSQEILDVPKDNGRLSDSSSRPNDSDGQQPRKVLLEQLGVAMGADDHLPDSFILINTADWHGQVLAPVLSEQDRVHRVMCTCSSADVKAIIAFIVNKIQKLRHSGTMMSLGDRPLGCNTNSKAPSPIKIAVAGNDCYINSVLRPYVEQFSAKSPDWQHYVKFLVIPLGNSSIGKFLSSVDSTYNSLFNDTLWRETFDKPEHTRTDSVMSDIVDRIQHYVKSASNSIQLPIAEAMITYKDKDKGTTEETSQIFVPFLNEVRIGAEDSFTTSVSVDLDESTGPLPTLSSSPPSQQGSNYMEKAKESHTPPNSPMVTHGPPGQGSMPSPATGSPPCELLELQLDYWLMPPKIGDHVQGDQVREKERSFVGGRKEAKEGKASVKSTFKLVQVCRLLQYTNGGSDHAPSSLSLVMVTKEKKGKIIKIGKRSKESENKSQVEGISRLICTSKTHSSPLRVYIDGVEWMGVKFFQLSSQWQTHIRHFPVLTFCHLDSPL